MSLSDKIDYTPEGWSDTVYGVLPVTDVQKAVKELKEKLGSNGDIYDVQGNIQDSIIDEIFGEDLLNE